MGDILSNITDPTFVNPQPGAGSLQPGACQAAPGLQRTLCSVVSCDNITWHRDNYPFIPRECTAKVPGNPELSIKNVDDFYLFETEKNPKFLSCKIKTDFSLTNNPFKNKSSKTDIYVKI